MSLRTWLAAPAVRRLPPRRSTVLLVVVFVGLVALYLAVRAEPVDLGSMIILPASTVDSTSPAVP